MLCPTVLVYPVVVFAILLCVGIFQTHIPFVLPTGKLQISEKRKYWNFKYPNMGNSWTRWIKKMLKECVSLTFL